MEFPTPESRIGVNMKNWIQDKAYDIKEDRLNPWRKHINTSEFGRRLEETGYKMPTKPKKKHSVFNIFCKLIAP